MFVSGTWESPPRSNQHLVDKPSWALRSQTADGVHLNNHSINTDACAGPDNAAIESSGPNMRHCPKILCNVTQVYLEYLACPRFLLIILVVGITLH